MKIPQWIYNAILIMAGVLVAIMVLGVMFGWIDPTKQDLVVKWITGLAAFFGGLLFNKED